MASSLDRRTRTLESLPAPIQPVSLEEARRHMLDLAAACGLTETDVLSTYGGWPGFAMVRMLQKVHSPEADAAWNERVARHKGDEMAAIFEMLGRQSGSSVR